MNNVPLSRISSYNSNRLSAYSVEGKQQIKYREQRELIKELAKSIDFILIQETPLKRENTKTINKILSYWKIFNNSSGKGSYGSLIACRESIFKEYHVKHQITTKRRDHFPKKKHKLSFLKDLTIVNVHLPSDPIWNNTLAKLKLIEKALTDDNLSIAGDFNFVENLKDSSCSISYTTMTNTFAKFWEELKVNYKSRLFQTKVFNWIRKEKR